MTGQGCRVRPDFLWWEAANGGCVGLIDFASLETGDRKSLLCQLIHFASFNPPIRYRGMSEASSIPQWLQQLQQGDAAAMQRLWDVFFSRLMGSAERHLQFVSPQKVEGEDVVASVFESIWDAAQGGRLHDVTDVDELLWILLAMTRRKCIDHVRRAQAEQRGGAQQPVSLDSPATLFAEIVSAEPDPRYLVDLNDEHQRILSKLSDRILREIAVLKIEGHRIDEIAKRVGVAETTVRRKLKIIRHVYLVELRNG